MQPSLARSMTGNIGGTPLAVRTLRIEAIPTPSDTIA